MGGERPILQKNDASLRVECCCVGIARKWTKVYSLVHEEQRMTHSSTLCSADAAVTVAVSCLPTNSAAEVPVLTSKSICYYATATALLAVGAVRVPCAGLVNSGKNHVYYAES